MSKGFTTPAGTFLPFMQLQGKDYLQVAHRVLWFREEKPDWSIETELAHATGGLIVKAVIKDASGKIKSMGLRYEAKMDDLERCETGAIGRALSILGYGTQFALDLEEGDGKLADAPIAKRENSNQKRSQDKPAIPSANTPTGTGKLQTSDRAEKVSNNEHTPQTSNLKNETPISMPHAALIYKWLEERKKPVESFNMYIEKTYGADVVSKLKEWQFEEVRKMLE